MIIDRHIHGQVAWVNLAAREPDRQSEFYRALLGWESVAPDDSEHAVFLSDGEQVAGMSPVAAAGMPTLWTVHIAVDDAADAVERVRELGGTVFRAPTEIDAGKQLAVVGDPSGAVLCLMEVGDDDGLRVFDEPGAPCWFEVMSTDAAGCVTFYEQLFGWTTTEADGGNEYYVFGNGENAIAGMLQLPTDAPSELQSFWQTSFSVPGSLDELIAGTTERDGRVAMGPIETAFGRGAVIADPAGATFVAFERH